MCEYTRQGPQKRLQIKRRAPTATGYQPDLYSFPGPMIDNPTVLETEFLQPIDDRGAKALTALEAGAEATEIDRLGLVQFVLSMIYRSPDRISYLENRLRSELADVPILLAAHHSIYRQGALGTFGQLVQSERMLSQMMRMSVASMAAQSMGFDLLTSDCPIIMSHGIAEPDGFIILPTGPKSFLLLYGNPKVPQFLARQPAKRLSARFNDAVARQAKEMIFALDDRQNRFIENRLRRMPGEHDRLLNPMSGMIPFRWRVD